MSTVCEEMECVENRRTQMPKTGDIYWEFDRRRRLAAIAGLLEKSSLLDVGHSHIAGVDAGGFWSLRLHDGFQPVDLDVLVPRLKTPRDVDRLGRGLLESRLIYEGMNPFHARWAVEEGVPWVYRHWVDDPLDSTGELEDELREETDEKPDYKPLTGELTKDGWDKAARELTKLVKSIKEFLPSAWENPGAIAWFLALQGPNPDGPSDTSTFGDETWDFWWNRLPYPVKNQPYKLASLLWSVDGHSLPISDVLAKVWKIPVARQRVKNDPRSKGEPGDISRVRSAASRFRKMFIAPGPSIVVEEHRLYSWKQVSLNLPR